MSLRFSCKNAVVALAGTAFTHGLGAVPDEWSFNHRGALPAASPPMYLSTYSTTTFTVCASSGATTGDIFCSLAHSIIQ